MNKTCFKILPEFETERLRLRAFKETDYENYIAWHCGDIPYYMMGIHYIKAGDTEGFKRLFLKNAPRMFITKESAIWCIAEKASDITIGKIEMCRFDAYANTAQIHYCLSKKERAKGYMTEAIRAVLKWAFEDLDLNRIYTYVWEENDASVNVLVKLGFALEGTLRENNANKFTLDGNEIKNTLKDMTFIEHKLYKNERIYGLLKSEYQCVK